MYYYSEVLRGKRALRVVAIILGVFLAIAIIFRLWALSEHNPEGVAQALQSSPTAHVVTKTLAGGTIETTVNDPLKRVHAVIDRNGRLFHMDVTLPAENPLSRQRFFSMGNSNVDRTRRAGMSHIVVTRDNFADLPLGILFAISCIIGLVTATMLGGVLAKENDGHLELVWTKPVSRERLALATIAVDVVTILISQFGMVIMTLIVCAMFVWPWPGIYTNAMTPAVIGLALIGPIAWYACLTAFSASLKRGLGMVVGLGWLAAIVTPGIAGGTAFLNSDIGRSIHVVFQALSYIDPIAYISFHGSLGSNGLQFHTAIGSIGTSALLLLGLTVIYLALAVLQWRRVEA
jgi:ABC-type transport system involved in multi-copper enzyme maturation permease subunit